MLSVISADEFDERYVAWQMNGVCQSWQQTSMICAEVHNAVTRYIYAKVNQTVPDNSWSDWLAFLPSFLRRKRKGRRGIKASDPNAAETVAGWLM